MYLDIWKFPLHLHKALKNNINVEDGVRMADVLLVEHRQQRKCISSLILYKNFSKLILEITL